MRGTAVALDSDAFADAKEVLMEEYDMTEEEAERRRETILTNVMLEAQEAGRDWERDEYMAVVDVLMGIQRQQMEAIEEMQQSRLSKVARYLPTILMLAALAQAVGIVWFMTMSGTLPLLVTAFVTVAVLVGANIFLS